MDYKELESAYAARRGKPYNKRVAFDAAFNESDHPRDSDGKFGSGGKSDKLAKLKAHEESARKIGSIAEANAFAAKIKSLEKQKLLSAKEHNAREKKLVAYYAKYAVAYKPKYKKVDD